MKYLKDSYLLKNNPLKWRLLKLLKKVHQQSNLNTPKLNLVFILIKLNLLLIVKSNDNGLLKMFVFLLEFRLKLSILKIKNLEKGKILLDVHCLWNIYWSDKKTKRSLCNSNSSHVVNRNNSISKLNNKQAIFYMRRNVVEITIAYPWKFYCYILQRICLKPVNATIYRLNS